jgi:hypothetical protein
MTKAKVYNQYTLTLSDANIMPAIDRLAKKNGLSRSQYVGIILRDTVKRQTVIGVSG